jgi:inhibitor of KinA sporulation pathway (predicted exonuclease)
VPHYLKRWINIKKVFQSPLDFTNASVITKCKPAISGMGEMLQKCGLELEGKHHSGIDDARNIARCVIKTMEQGYEYTQGMVHNANY